MSITLDLSPANVRKTQDYPIAIGHFADVFAGQLRTPSGAVRKVAIKSIRGVPYDDAVKNEMRANLIMLESAWRRLKHPNIAPFIGLAFHFTHIASLITPLYANGNVLNYLEANKNANRVNLIADVSAGLRYLHSLEPSVVHGDLKGSNVLVKDDGSACLVDYSLIGFTDSGDFTSASIAGPCRYQSPEILLSDETGHTPYTTRSDVYAFAMVALEIITEKPPFMHRRQDTAVIFDVLAGRRPPKPAASADAELLWPIMTACWDQDPQKRPDMAHVHARVPALRP